MVAGVFARLVRRARGVENTLRPSIDRWQIARREAPLDVAFERSARDDAREDPALEWSARPGEARGREPEPRAHEAFSSLAFVPADRRASNAMSADQADGTTQLMRRQERREPPPPGGADAPETAVAAPARAEPPRRKTGERRLLPLGPAPTFSETRALAHARTISRETPTASGPAPVHVHIGRIDVRAADAPAAKARPTAAPALPRPSLETHLRERDRGTQ